MLPDYSPSERVKRVKEILAEGALLSLGLGTLNPIKGFNFYRRAWEQAAVTEVVIGPSSDNLPVVVTN